jgi:fructokinase
MLPASLPSGDRALHVGTLGLVFEPMATTIAGLIEREHENLLVMVDPNIRPSALPNSPPPFTEEGQGGSYRSRLERVISQSAIVKASDADMEWLYPEADLETAARALVGRGPSLVVVTLGAGGAFGVCAGTEVRVPAPVVEVLDTIGAGDAFGAGLLAWLYDHDRLNRDLRLKREELRAALEFACLVASITCTRAGADPPRRADLHHP